MKMTLLVFCLVLTTAAFGQYNSSINSQPQPYHSPEHPAHASYAPMASGQSVVGGGGYIIAQGDRPASDFPQQVQMSLGEAARELRKQHQQVKKARVVWTDQ